MLNPQIAEKIQAKVTGLVGLPLAVADADGQLLTGDLEGAPERWLPSELADSNLAIEFRYAGTSAGYIVLNEELPNHEEVRPLIRSIAELVMHQSVLVDALPQQEERLDKFIYDLLHNPVSDSSLVGVEAKLFDLDLERPRLALVLDIDDPLLPSVVRAPSSDRELRIGRYKTGILRALNSFYTHSPANLVAYIGGTKFVVLKDLHSDPAGLDEARENFKRSIPTVYNILASEIKLPTTVGVGNYHSGLGGLRQSYEEGVSALNLGRQLWGQKRVYHIDDFGVVAPLLSGVDTENIYFSRELLEKLGESDDMTLTLETFFDHNMGLSQTAESLKIHRNTLVYRLDRIHTNLGLDPRVFDDAVQIKLAILYTKFVEVADVY